jgi:lipoprotein-anchoring transpeptidase ErfK/SrfK
MSKKRNIILPALLIVMGCAVFLFAAWSAINSPVMASLLNSPQPQPEVRSQPFAQVNIAKPSTSEEFVATPTALIPAAVPQGESAPTAEVSNASLPGATPDESSSGMVYAAIVPDTPTPEYTAPTAAVYAPITGSGEHWIDVDLSQQRVYAYEGETVVNSFLVSTGTWQTPTVTGRYNVWTKLRSAAMSGPGYYLPNVPYIMYFYGSYGLHGTYWHNNFGTPMSHGCVNLSIPDAEWLYNFSTVGTVVNVHY